MSEEETIVPAVEPAEPTVVTEEETQVEPVVE
jgi:hypothetical protein